MKRKFAVFILTHGRSGNVKTYDALRKWGYTGKIYLLVDDEDSEIAQYKAIYKNEVLVFPKQDAVKITDAGNNFGRKDSPVFARNWNFNVAKKLGLTHFLQLDDDYTAFRWSCNNDLEFLSKSPTYETRKLDISIQATLDFLDVSGAFAVAWAQTGDFMGGPGSSGMQCIRGKIPMRKVMNSFFLRTDRPFCFLGTMNDDVSAYVSHGSRGMLFLTIPRMKILQGVTQAKAGGLTDLYQAFGTYVKSFHTVLYAPSCTKINTMGKTERRIHHRISWKQAVPLIISEKYRKRKDKKSHGN